MSEQYRETKDLTDPKIVDDLFNVIRNMIRKEIRKATFNRMIPAEVINVGAGTADVQLLIDGTPSTITGLANKTGEVLSVSDEVYVELINNSSSNIYIAVKK